ncbi:hypothetical protein AVEN_50089-1 [Araneus ventricosus]|uniref:Uncharacterized protein n=1 Tax=Araneus ventricosus TaxID=182803 RepID=A0A4Y2SMR5_ARAVE|nr:hypothetical protein AVEN_50089-1 [Araneus ventricosus]
MGVCGDRRPLMTYLDVISFHMKQKLPKSVWWLRLADSVKNFLPNYFKYIDVDHISIAVEYQLAFATSLCACWCGAEVWRGGAGSGVVLVICSRFRIMRYVPK